MKALLFFLLFGLSLEVSAAPPAFKGTVVGDFAVRDEFVIEHHRRYEFVLAESADGKARMDDLLADGYSCTEHNHSKTLCSKQIQDNGFIPLILADAVHEKWSGLFLSLREPVSAPQLDFYTNFYAQWSVEQKCLIRTGIDSDPEIFYEVLYTVTEPDRWKVFLGDPLGKNYSFVYESSKKLRVEDQFHLENGNVQDTYSVMIVVEKLK